MLEQTVLQLTQQLRGGHVRLRRARRGESGDRRDEDDGRRRTHRWSRGSTTPREKAQAVDAEKEQQTRAHERDDDVHHGRHEQQVHALRALVPAEANRVPYPAREPRTRRDERFRIGGVLFARPHVLHAHVAARRVRHCRPTKLIVHGS